MRVPHKVLRRSQLAELQLFHLYLSRFNRKEVLENRRRASKVDASTQTEPEKTSDVSPCRSPVTCPSGEPTTAAADSVLRQLLEAPVAQPRPLSTTYRFLSPSVDTSTLAIRKKVAARKSTGTAPRKALLLSPTTRKPTASQKPGQPRSKVKIVSEIPVNPPMIFPRITVPPSGEPFDLLVSQ